MRQTFYCADGVTYIPVPFKGAVLDVWATAQADPGATNTVTVAKGSDTVNLVTVTDSSTAGTVYKGVRDATNKKLMFSDSTPIKITCASGNSVAFYVTVEFDEFARTLD